MVTQGKVFQPTNKSMFPVMLRSEIIQWLLNKTPLWNIPKRNWLFKKLVAHIDGNAYCVYSPLHFQQGNNTYIGKNFFCNFNCTILDHTDVHIGDNVMIGPNVTILTVSHPLIPEQRNVRPFPNTFEPHGRGDIELLAPVTIGNSVWIATGSIICPGVTIGDNAVIGAGSIVTHDIPANTLAFGTPCEVVRPITEEDRIELKEENPNE